MDNRTPAKSFLRWVGGKARRSRLLAERLATYGSDGTYFEPFVGGASVFFALSPYDAVIGDANDDLMCVYRHVRSDPRAVWEQLQPLTARQAVSDYHAIRRSYNEMSCSSGKAAHFIYLNRMCFNGIYRVNRAGEFNVPFGGKSNPGFPELELLKSCSRVLRRARLRNGDFAKVLETARSGDVVYLDPPYLPLNGTSYFRHYTKHRFNLQDHIRLAETVENLAERGVNVMITVGDSPEIRTRYQYLNIDVLSVRRYVGSNGERKPVRELILTTAT